MSSQVSPIAGGSKIFGLLGGPYFPYSSPCTFCKGLTFVFTTHFEEFSLPPHIFNFCEAIPFLCLPNSLELKKCSSCFSPFKLGDLNLCTRPYFGFEWLTPFPKFKRFGTGCRNVTSLEFINDWDCTWKHLDCILISLCIVEKLVRGKYAVAGGS